ncbi:MAG: methyltransferase domain-containing protein [Bacteroidales bacterium]|nr:methyltransferase domain-containing protein [Bacteroidales bacterium]MBN2820181.1 methyltransferase domain-containing protein [Bacteroidales bacterium]
MALVEINNRYSTLAEDNCCLSCGGAIDYSKPQKGEICVDLGSGRGTDVLRMAAEVGETGFVYGIDISDGMLKKAESTAKKMQVTNVSFKKAVLEDLPVDSDSVDLLISNCTINHADNKQEVWNEVYRILKIGGRFVVSDIFSTKPVPEEYRNDPQAISECWGGSVTREEYLNQLEKAGFNKIEVIEESKPYPKGSIEVCSFTIRGFKKKSCCN